MRPWQQKRTGAALLFRRAVLEFDLWSSWMSSAWTLFRGYTTRTRQLPNGIGDATLSPTHMAPDTGSLHEETYFPGDSPQVMLVGGRLFPVSCLRGQPKKRDSHRRLLRVCSRGAAGQGCTPHLEYGLPGLSAACVKGPKFQLAGRIS